MPPIRRIREGTLSGLFIGHRRKSIKVAASELRLTFSGVDGDVHSGGTREADAREPGFPRHTALANLRQISLVSTEELSEIAERLNIPLIDPKWLAANIAIVGAGPITQWPRGTIVRFPSGAAIYITDINSPCRLAAKLIARQGGHSDNILAGFVKAALGRRGLVGLVYAEGVIRLGDAVERLEPRPERPTV